MLNRFAAYVNLDNHGARLPEAELIDKWIKQIRQRHGELSNNEPNCELRPTIP